MFNVTVSLSVTTIIFCMRSDNLKTFLARKFWYGVIDSRSVSITNNNNRIWFIIIAILLVSLKFPLTRCYHAPYVAGQISSSTYQFIINKHFNQLRNSYPNCRNTSSNQTYNNQQDQSALQQVKQSKITVLEIKWKTSYESDIKLNTSKCQQCINIIPQSQSF